LLIYGSFVFPLEEVEADAGVDVAPGKEFIHRALTVSVEVGVKPDFIEGTEPCLIIEVLAPGIEGGAQFEGSLDNLTQAPVAPRQ
jgi:hypothetical protein